MTGLDNVQTAIGSQSRARKPARSAGGFSAFVFVLVVIKPDRPGHAVDRMATIAKEFSLEPASRDHP